MKNRLFQISQVAVEQFATFSIPPTDSNRTNVDITLDISLNDERKFINCTLKVIIKIVDEIIITLQVKCTYSVKSENWDQIFLQDENSQEKFVLLLNDIADQTLATSRGILYSKTEGTLHNRYLLPIFDLGESIKAIQKK